MTNVGKIKSNWGRYMQRGGNSLIEITGVSKVLMMRIANVDANGSRYREKQVHHSISFICRPEYSITKRREPGTGGHANVVCDVFVYNHHHPGIKFLEKDPQVFYHYRYATYSPNQHTGYSDGEAAAAGTEIFAAADRNKVLPAR